jgi:peptide/nickel transport system ATP-binding protein
MTQRPVLEVNNLTVSYKNPFGFSEAVKGVSFSLNSKQSLAIVGESGSGKTTIFNSVLGLLPAAALVSGEVILKGRSLKGLTESGYRKIRGRRIGMVVQDPLQGLDPVRSIGSQIIEMLLIHKMCARRQARDKTLALLDEVQIKDPYRVIKCFPHQLSGGMAQRVMIAMVLAGEPEVLVADEPTSALDERLKEAVLELIASEMNRRGLALAIISHDLDLVSRHADRILVMHAGRAVEEIAGRDIHKAVHPYTRALLSCRPRLRRTGTTLPTPPPVPDWL